MPSKKKRPFIEKNACQKFLLMHGRENAVNADGKTLPNLLVPIANNFKPGTSVIMKKLAELINGPNSPAPPITDDGFLEVLRISDEQADDVDPDKDLDLEKILDQFEDAPGSDDDEEDCFGTSEVDLDKLALRVGPSNKLGDNDYIVEEEFEDDGDESVDSSDFSDDDSDFGETSNFKRLSLQPNCPENLTILDECIDKKLEEYDDDQLGAVDYEDVCGYLTGENEHVNYYIGTSKKFLDEEVELGNYDKSMKEKILQYSEEEHVEKTIKIVSEKPPEFDCQSIISTYSNKYNHPALIKEGEKVRKIKIPNNPLQKQLTKSRLKQLDSDSESEVDSDEDNVSVASTVNMRPKGETPEQRQERKKMFREMKNENRRLKKENKLAFKHEKKLQIAEKLNLQNNRGVRLF